MLALKLITILYFSKLFDFIVFVIDYKFNNNLMKGKVQSHSAQASFSGKRHSLNHDRISQPYKVDWGANPIQ